jgi:hypothetical protein
MTASNRPETTGAAKGAPTHSANDCFGQMVVLGSVGCNARLGSAEVVAAETKSPGLVSRALSYTERRVGGVAT